MGPELVNLLEVLIHFLLLHARDDIARLIKLTDSIHVLTSQYFVVRHYARNLSSLYYNLY
jgi:hypothetical protein